MSPTQRKFPVVGAVVAVAVGGVSPGLAQGSAQPCALLTPEQVGGALGTSVSAGQPIGTTGCQWSPPNQSGTIVTISLWDGQKFAAAKAALPSVTKEPVSGLGDDAFFATFGNLTSLSVKKGAVDIVFHLYGIPDKARQETIEKTLAAEALAKI
jgi:hypothetical protein